MTPRSPFRYFKTSPEIIRLAVMLYIRFQLSLRNVEDLLHERGVEISRKKSARLVEPGWSDVASQIHKGLAGFVRVLTRNYQQARFDIERELGA
jgi:transposase-like protein